MKKEHEHLIRALVSEHRFPVDEKNTTNAERDMICVIMKAYPKSKIGEVLLDEKSKLT